MSGWILNITGMIFISVILEMILPSGKTGSFIKMVFALFVLYVIVQPIPKIFNKDITFTSQSANKTETNFLISNNIAKINAIENDLKNAFSEKGLDNVAVIVSANIYEENFKITKIYVDLINLVLKQGDEHININKEIQKIVAEKTGMEEVNIIIYGR